MSGIDKFCGSEFWNLSVTWYTNEPDFTECFEKTVLAWIPCVFLWIFALLDIYYTNQSKTKDIPWNTLNITKLIATLLLMLLSLVDEIYYLFSYIGGSETVFPVNLTTPIFRMGTFLLVAIMVELCRRKGVRTSGTQFLFWFLMLLFGLPEYRTKFIKKIEKGEGSYEFISYMIYYPLVLAMFVFNCFADSPPKIYKYPRPKNVCPEANASFLSKVLFTWYDSFAWLGYKRPLVVNDLWDLEYENSSRGLIPEFEKHWKNELRKISNVPDVEIVSELVKENGDVDAAAINYRAPKKKKQASIMKPLIKSFGVTFVFGSLLKLVQDLLTFVSPEILSLLMSFTEDKAQPLWKGMLYAVLMFATAMLQTLFLSQYFHKMYLIGFRIRSSVTSVIYKKALRISNIARKDFTLGEIVNLMSVDTQKFVELTPYMSMLWSGPLQITLALIFLWKYLGPSVLAGLAVMLILTPVNIYLASKNKALQIIQMKNKDRRVKLMNEILNGIKVLKLYAWELGFENEILKIRQKELRVLRQQAYLNAIVAFVFACAPFLVSLVSFAVYVLSSDEHVLDATTAFVSISLFNILRFPLTMLPMMITTMVQASVSVRRINKFLNADELSPDSVTHDSTEESQLLIENGTFTWGEHNEAPILRNINLRVDKGALIAVVGTVGAGKSSLVSALLGEMTKIYGKVNTKGSIAYVPQQAWIQNATLRNNITFGNQLNSKVYDNIIDSCALKPDFDVLPARDETEIGEKGINLSGGQKQRVSLARAVYSDADNYFLDDPLSAVDAHVGKHIFERVIGPNGLLKNKTRILVTHSITYLPEVDVIVVIKDGTISEIGTYEELLAKEGAFAEFLLNHVQEVISDTDEEELNKLKGMFDENTILGSKITRQISSGSDHGSVNSLHRQRSTMEDMQKPPVVGEKLIEIEKAETGNIKWKVYAYYFSSIGLFLTFTTLLFNILYQAFYVGSSIWLTVWTSDESAVINGTQDEGKRNMYLGVYGLLGAGQAFTTMVGALALFVGMLKASGLLHRNVLRRVLRCPVSLFDVTPVGRVISRFSYDTDVLDNTLPMNLRFLISSTGTVISTLFVICYSTPAFLTVILPIAAIYYFVQRFYVATSRQLKRLESISRSPVYSHFGETIQGVQSVRAYSLQERFIRENEEKVDFNQACYYPNIIANRWLAVRLESVGNFIIFFAALFAVLGREYISSGLVGLSISYALQITQTLNWLVRMTSEVETNIVAVERIKEYGEAPQEADWEIPSKQLSKSWPDNGLISFENLQIRYREGLDLVLKGLTLSINGGEKVGIVGRTGAGKSSLTLSLFRIIEPAGGKIVIDGVDITSIGLHTLRSRLTIIPQDPVLFSGSLRINLDPLNEYPDESIWNALKMAHLSSHVTGLESGLQHEVTEGGDNFSVGQRQLICLARALLRKTKILILDEATAAVDLETDDLIQRTIRSEFKDCTVLTIAHRLNTIMDSDRVIVLDKGVMVEYDSPGELLKKRDSSFYKMAHDAGIA